MSPVRLTYMLRRAPTRLELKSEDMKELDDVLAERRAKAKGGPVAQPEPAPQQPNERHDRIGFKPPTTNK